MAGNYKQLKAQIAKLEEEAAALRKAEASEAIATIKALIDEFDLTAEDLGFKTGRKAVTKLKSAGVPKYRDPETGKTWTGRGKPPAWISAAAKAGKADAFLIEKATPAAPAAPAAPVAKRRARAAKAEAAPAAGETTAVKKRGTRAAAKKTAAKAEPKPKAPRRSRKNAAQAAVAETGAAPAMESVE